ncbi:MAG: winged helix DNA-binding domain-containing protein [Caldilineaceae bacterium]
MTIPLPLTPEQIRWFRLRRSGLLDPFATAEQTVHTLFGVQAQILPAAALALWNRTRGLTYQRFEKILYTERTLVKLWGQRGTLHLYASADWPLLHAARSVNLTWWERDVRKAQEKAEEKIAGHEALITQVAELLRQRDSMGRADLRAENLAIAEELFSAWGGIFADLVRRGYACHAGRIGNEGHFAHRERWLPNLVWNPPDAETANSEVLRRYWAAYGPSTVQDFAYWRAVSNAQARGWLKSLENEVAEVQVNGQTMLILRDDVATVGETPPDAEAWPVRMLYRFDPLLLAHKDKAWVADAAHYKQIWRPAGHIEGIVLAHGRAVATWRYDRKGKGLVVSVSAFQASPHYVKKAIAKIAPEIAEFFGLPLQELVLSRVGQ